MTRPDDIRDVLRRDHDKALAQIDAVGAEADARRASARLARVRPGSLEWHARLSVVRDLVARHVGNEDEDLLARLAERFDAQELVEMGRRFVLARDKLTMLEEAKAA